MMLDMVKHFCFLALILPDLKTVFLYSMSVENQLPGLQSPELQNYTETGLRRRHLVYVIFSSLLPECFVLLLKIQILLMSSRLTSFQPDKLKSKKNNQPFNKAKFKEKRLVLTIFRLATKIISYARTFSIKLKRKNSHQVMLFPGSVMATQTTSLDRNESLIRQYERTNKDWYPFYFSSCHIYIDNRHLDLFQTKAPLPIDYSYLGLGKVICFGELVGYTANLSRQSKNMRGSKKSDNGLKRKQSNIEVKRQSFFEAFEQRINVLNVGDIKSKLKNSITGFSIPLQQQTEEQIETKNVIFLGTDSGHILTINSTTKKTCNIKIQPGSPIDSISVYKNYLKVESKNTLYFYKFQVNGGLMKFKQLFNLKLSAAGQMHRTNFVRIGGFYFIFYIDIVGVKKAIAKERKFSNILLQGTLCQPDKYNPFTNLKLFHQATLNRILITASSTKQILIYSYHYAENKQSLLYKMPNPKNPPMNPRVHTFSCIEYFPKSSKRKVEEDKGQLRNSIKQNDVMNDGFNFLAEQQQCLIVGVSFTQRVYFIRLWEDRVEISKRAKFFCRVIKIQMYQQEGVIVVLHKSEETKQRTESQPQVNEQPKQKPPKIQIVATLLQKIMSFNIPIHTQILQKITYEKQIGRQFEKIDEKANFRTSFLLTGQELLILTDDHIERIGITTWEQIYKRMLKTQNIQLLNFLIILKNHRSLYIRPPESWEGLQKFFPATSTQNKQILLQYYYETGQQPPPQLIKQIQSNNPDIMLPFILEHKISNLSENCKQQLIECWKNKDKRVVEELIMAGCQFGWELAIKEGWMRALRKIVSMGLQIHFPLLKLSSFVVADLQKLQKLDQVGNQDPDYENKCDQILKRVDEYCAQMIDYAALALEYFLDPEQIQQLDDLKQFILTLLRNEIIGNCIKYKPKETVKLISKLFANPQRVILIDKLTIQDFIHSQKQFKSIVRTNYLNVSECLLSYLSEIYRQLTQTKQYTIDQQTKFRELLAVQHAKLIRVSMQNNRSVNINPLDKNFQNKKGKFQFVRSYLIETLLILVNHNNEYLKDLIHDEYIQIEKDRDEFQCYMEDLLVKIWLDAKDSPINNLDNLSNNVTPMQPEEIKNVMISLQQINGSNNFLLICLMLDLPSNEYSVKILRKFIYSQNVLIQQRLFDWLMPMLQKNQDKQIRAALENELMNNLKNIIEINKEQSRVLFDSYFQNKEKEIIRKIDNDPHLQLEYLEMIILDSTQNQVDIEEYYLNLYIKLLILVEPSRVIGVLEESFASGKSQQIKYDLQEALKVSLQIEGYNEKNKVETYLYQKLGQIQKCISSYLKILEAYFWEYIDIYESRQEKSQAPDPDNPFIEKAENKDEYEYQEGNKTKKKLSLISQMISHKLHSKSDTKRIELQENISTQFKELTDLIFRQSIKKYEYLKIPLDAMVFISEEFRHQKLKYLGHYLGMLGFFFGRIIVESFEKNCFEFFNQWLRNQTKIDLNSVKKFLHEGYKKVLSHQNLLRNVSQIDKKILLQNVREAMYKVEKSVFSEALCSVCNQNFDEYQGESILFNCGHLFHSTCIEQDDNGQDYCWECMYKNQMQGMIDHSQLNIVALTEKYCRKKSVMMGVQREKKEKQVIISIGKKRTNRLAIFDKKVTSLDNQAEILGMKLELLEYYQNSVKKQ